MAGQRIVALRMPLPADVILDRVRAIPEGFVRTYGDLSPGAPRRAGWALARCEDPAVPWHRVVRADGSLAKGEPQRALLEDEGVPFRGGRVDLRVARCAGDVAAA
jgi:methylated-DNA-protein-cysteine methyltransferase related protein